MKRKFSILTVFMAFAVFHSVGFSQTEEKQDYKQRVYKISVLGQKKESRQGYLANSNDSAIYLSLNAIPFKSVPVGGTSTRAIAYYDIQSITLIRKGNIGKGALYGLVTGAVVGGTIGLISGDDPPDTFFATTAGEKAVAGAIVTGVIGTLLGTLIGALTQHKFIINGNKERLFNMNQTMEIKIRKDVYK